MRKIHNIFLVSISLIIILPGLNSYTPGILYKEDEKNSDSTHTESEFSSDFALFLPIILNPYKIVQRINVPYFEGDIRKPETAIFWFGQVVPTNNYADVRVGYNDNILFVRTTAFDRRMWYDPTPAPDNLTEWDAVSLYLNIVGNNGVTPNIDIYKLVGQINWWEGRAEWQAGYRGNGSKWVLDTVDFITESDIRGTAPNNEQDDRGWLLTFWIPFSSLGLSGPPTQGTIWGLAINLHDRDDASGTPISNKTWPMMADPNSPKTWGQISFGLPIYTAPSVKTSSMITIRHNLNGARVDDGHVGGHTICGQDYWPNFFDGWGDANYAGYEQINIQNQGDVADWPCFSKYYVTFPLDSIPPGKVILSAKLRLHQFGNSGQGGDYSPQPSLIQISTIYEEWDEDKLTWNNAPLAKENVSQSWVNPLDTFPGWPGVPYEWDISGAVAEAYTSGEPLRLALYSADSEQHSGKYFVSSDTDEWNTEGRPTLEVYFGDP